MMELVFFLFEFGLYLRLQLDYFLKIEFHLPQVMRSRR